MMNRTPRLSKSAIEYLDYVWNFASGCTKDCAYCWARKIACRFADRYPNGFEPTIYPEALLSPLHLKKHSIIGCVFMGDLFDPGIDPNKKVEWFLPSGIATVRMALRGWVFTTIKQCPQHTFLFLTKQAQNLAKWAPFPDNCWVGVSVTGYWEYVDACNYLSQIDAKVKYLSLEPLLSWDKKASYFFNSSGVKWVIIGAQTKPYIAPEVEWVKEIVGAADRAGIPVFLKNSMKASIYTPDIMADNPNLLRTLDDHGIISVNVRQEMPTDG